MCYLDLLVPNSVVQAVLYGDMPVGYATYARLIQFTQKKTLRPMVLVKSICHEPCVLNWAIGATIVRLQNRSMRNYGNGNTSLRLQPRLA